MLTHNQTFWRNTSGMLIIICLGFLSTFANAETVFSTGKGKVGEQLREVLSIPGAEALEVTISGEIHKQHDVLRIYTASQGKTMYKIFEKQGKVTTKKPLIVAGNQITVTLNSNGKVTRKGATVRIARVSPASRLQHIKHKIYHVLQNIDKQQAGKVDRLLTTNFNSLDRLQKQLKTTASINENDDKLKLTVSQTFAQLASTYSSIASMKDEVLTANREEIKKLKQLQAETREYANRTSERQKGATAALANLQNIPEPKDAIAKTRRKIAIKAKQSMIKSLEIQIEAWDNFYQTQLSLMPALELYQQHLGLIFYTLGVHAEIYQEAALVIPHDLHFAQETLSGLTELNNVLRDFAKDWENLKSLQKRLQSIGL